MDERTRTGSAPFSSSGLLCDEDDDDAFLKLDLDKYMHVTEHEDDHYVQYLVDRESSNGFGSKCFLSSSNESWLRCARMDAIQWILKFGGMYNFRCETIFLFVTYFDRFLSVLPIDVSKFPDLAIFTEGELSAARNLAVGCLSLAIKMEENSKLFLKRFSEQLEGYDFEREVIFMSQLIVLEALEWKMTPMSPFTHVHYFFNKFFGEHRPSKWVLKAAQLMMNVTKEINLMDHRPSIVAAAAVLVAIGGQLTKEELMLTTSSVMPSWGSKENEQLFSFYKRTLENVETPTPVVTSNLSSMHSSLFDFIESSSHPVAARIKRKLACYIANRGRKRKCTGI